MWQALRDIVDNVKQSLGVETPALPDASAVTDAAGQAGEAVTTAADTATSAATGAATAATDAAANAADAVTGVGEQLTSKVSDFLGRFSG
ncbi:hypothetical protein [Actinoplanes awajinensis]|uniref:Uncharacterized protein n=1 Tax=Actinoplanes awajinensis subsp. mycoplanecinus TaxID=135947 RepID=A0A101JHK0_9ACTN|nr:hypothetical protein [Actinoplanes awajinensis]KUL26925.1 hypothetical protein ADL15_36955 [Actinoplanes awajinensis subsp. mycoplanecinus]